MFAGSFQGEFGLALRCANPFFDSSLVLEYLGALACAQNDTTLYRTDLNGHRVAEEAFDTSLVKDGHATRELSQSSMAAPCLWRKPSKR